MRKILKINIKRINWSFKFKLKIGSIGIKGVVVLFLFGKEKPDLDKFEQFNDFNQEMFKTYKENKQFNESKANEYELHYFDILDNQ